MQGRNGRCKRNGIQMPVSRSSVNHLGSLLVFEAVFGPVHAVFTRRLLSVVLLLAWLQSGATPRHHSLLGPPSLA